MKFMVGVPTVGGPTWPMFDTLLQLRTPDGSPYRYKRVKGKPVDEARCELADALMLSDCDGILMADSDAGLHPDTLVHLASWDQPIVGALCFSRYVPPMPTICCGRTDDYTSYFTYIDETVDWLKHHIDLAKPGPAILDPAPADSLRALHTEEGGFTGGHCILIRREVFEALEPPWFSNRKGYEDRYFCEKAIAAGFPLYVDRSVVAGHVIGDERQIGALDFLAWDMITDWATRSFHIGEKHGKNAAAAA